MSKTVVAGNVKQWRNGGKIKGKQDAATAAKTRLFLVWSGVRFFVTIL